MSLLSPQIFAPLFSFQKIIAEEKEGEVIRNKGGMEREAEVSALTPLLARLSSMGAALGLALLLA